jgi:hypothetical protein
MFRWLPAGEGSDRDRVLKGYRARLDALAASGEDEQLRVGKALSLIWHDFERESGGLDAYAAAARAVQKDLIVRLVNYEASCREEDNLSEAIAAELLSYLLAMIAAKDADGERTMSRPIEELAKIGDPQIRFRRIPPQASQ